MRRALSLGVCATLGATSAWAGCNADSGTPPQAAELDGGIDAGVWSADAEADASADAPADASGDAFGAFDAWGSPCVGAEHYFCDDFDEDGGFKRWDDTVLSAGVAMEVGVPPAGVTAVSAPHVVSVRVPPEAGAVAQIHTYVAPNGYHCELAIMLEHRGADTAVPIAVRLGNPNAIPPNYQVELQFHADGSDVIREHGLLPDGGMLAAYSTPIPPLPQGQWFQVSFDLAFGARSIVTASINGTRVVAQPHYDLTQYSQPTHEMLTMGIIAGTGAAPWSVLFDNVVCDPMP